MIARRHLLVSVAALTVGIIAGAAWPPPPLSKAAANANQWSIPSTTDIARHNPADMATIASSMRWNGDTGMGPQEKSKWRLAGIVNDEGPAILVITTESDSTAKRVIPGETLPDGSLLESVESDRATTRLDACLTTYQLFQSQPIARSGDCEGTEVIDQGTSE